MPQGEKARDEEAVSPVVGTILVLLIATVGIMLVLFWGLPAIQTIQDRTQFDAMTAQFGNVDGAMEDLLKGTPEKATRITYSIPGGEIRFDANPSWVVTAYYTSDDQRVGYSNWADGDASFTIHNLGSDLDDATATVSRVDGNTKTPIAASVGAPGWTSLDLTLTEPMAGKTWQITYLPNSGPSPTVTAESWILPLGRISYLDKSSVTSFRVDAEGSAIFARQDPSPSVMQAPPSAIRENDDNEVLDRFTLWGFSLLNPDAQRAIGGAGRGAYPVLLALRDNYLRVDTSEAYKIDLGATGDLQSEWYRYFTTQHGFTRWGEGGLAADTDGGVHLATDDLAEPTFSFAFIQPWVTISAPDRPVSVN